MKPHLSFRLILGDDIALGPGKVQLLEAIRDTGSIAAAGREMGMSYKRAWHLVDTMNRCFESPLVEASKGGAHGGGAQRISCRAASASASPSAAPCCRARVCC
ncbi:MAG: LysR family transcriptional regulator [Thiobacillus sp.]|nr:LysR family transcriptional regulator [Thiobacillus sp.]